MKLKKTSGGKVIWTPEAIAYIVRRQSEGATLKAIAMRLGVGSETVKRMFVTATGRPWPTIKYTAVKTAIAEPSYRAAPLGRWPDGVRFEDVAPADLAREMPRLKATRSHPPIGPLTRVPGAGRGMAIPQFGGAR